MDNLVARLSKLGLGRVLFLEGFLFLGTFDYSEFCGEEFFPQCLCSNVFIDKKKKVTMFPQNSHDFLLYFILLFFIFAVLTTLLLF